MIVTYSPVDGKRRQWSYKSADLPSSEAEDVEEVTGLLFDDWQQKLLQGGMRARRALLWVLRRRDEPGLKFGDVAFTVGELEVDFDTEEKTQLRAEVEKSDELSDADRRRVLELLADEENGEVGKDHTPQSLSAPDG